MIELAYRAAKPLLFRADPETVHDRTMSVLGLISRSPTACRLLGKLGDEPDPRLVVEIDGLRLPGPIGIAAGLDKNGVAYPALHALGWDFVEIGTITPQPQLGNPKPRVFRLPEDRALINRMGFPGQGAESIAGNLARRKHSGIPVGCNIGPNKASVEAGLDAVIGDLTLLARRFAPLASYLVVNLSSPNTARLRELQGRDALRVLLTEVRSVIPGDKPTPLFVKIAPDLTDREISDVVEVVQEVGLSGIVATNTTVARPDTLMGASRAETGGLSGAPLRVRSLEVVTQIARESGGAIPIIAVGGLFDAGEVLAALKAGAAAVQIYTGMIYQGPALARQIKRQILTAMDATGATSLTDLRQAAT